MTDQVVSQDKILEIEESLVNILINAYQAETIEYDQLKKAGAYILENISKVKSHEDLVYFLQNLSGYWEVFKHLANIEVSTKQHEQNDKEAIEEIQNYIRNLQNK
jgi:hypothetical protein